MLGTVQKLRWCGAVCPFFESDEERAIRVADLLLQAVPIRWYRRILVQPYPVQGSTLMEATNEAVCCSCGGGSEAVPGSVRKPSTETTRTDYVGIDATLNLIDSRNGPALLIKSNMLSFVDDDDVQTANSTDSKEQQSLSKTIPLKGIRIASRGDAKEWEKIGLLDVKDSGIILLGKEGGSKSLVCQVMGGSKLSLSRDECIKQLNTIIAWDQPGPIEDDVTVKEESTELQISRPKQQTADKFAIEDANSIDVRSKPVVPVPIQEVD